MPDKFWYEEWFGSPWYHWLYSQRNEEEAKRFVDQLLFKLKPAPESSILDVACGRGRHSRILAEKGFVVTGIDIAFTNIEYAIAHNIINEENGHLNPEFYRHDMRLPFRTNYYDLVLNFFTSFGYFNSRREDEDAVRTMAASLKRGGKLVIDYLNVHYADSHMVYNEQIKFDETEFEIHRWQDENHFYKKIFVKDPQLNQPTEFTEKVARYSLGDFTDMLSYRGLQVQDVFGDYSLGSYDIKTSPRLILIAAK